VSAEAICIVSSRFFPRLFNSGFPLALTAALLLPLPLAGQTTPQPSAQAPAAQPTAPLSAEDQARVTQLQASLQSAIARATRTPPQKILNQLGDLWLRVGNPQNATDAYNRAANAARLAQDAQQGVAALNGLGNAARAQNQPRDAAQDYQRALDVATAQGVPAGKADALNALALLSETQNQGSRLSTTPIRHSPFASPRRPLRTGAILVEIATGYNSVGDTQQALDYGNRALDLYRAAGDHTGEATTLIGIGDIYAGLRDKKCIDAWTQALAAARQFHFPLVEAEALNRLGWPRMPAAEPEGAGQPLTRRSPFYQRLNMTDRGWPDA